MARRSKAKRSRRVAWVVTNSRGAVLWGATKQADARAFAARHLRKHPRDAVWVGRV